MLLTGSLSILQHAAKLYVVLVITKQPGGCRGTLLFMGNLNFRPNFAQLFPGFCVLPLAFLSYVRAKSYLRGNFCETKRDTRCSGERIRLPLPVLNGKSTFLSCFPIKLDKVWCVPKLIISPNLINCRARIVLHASTLVGK